MKDKPIFSIVKSPFSIVIGFAAFILVASIIFSAALYFTEETVEVLITDKERIVESSENGVTSKYLVFSETEVFENTDTFLFFKWNSSDVQGQLIPGHMYRVRVYGFRVPFLSMYRNIIEVKEEIGHVRSGAQTLEKRQGLRAVEVLA